MKAKILRLECVTIIRFDNEIHHGMPLFQVVKEGEFKHIGHVFFRPDTPINGYNFLPAKDVSFGPVSLADISEFIERADKCKGVFPDATKEDTLFKSHKL